jgi:threonine dehydratase
MTTEWGRYRASADSLLDAIGMTPLVRLARVAPDVELFAKVEWYGPTGSVKDRIYARMLTEAERRGELRPGMSVIECTTGNAGIACAAVAAIKGYPCVIVMPEGMSPERKRMIETYGAELVLTPGAGTDIDLALAKMREIVASDPDRYYFPASSRTRTTPPPKARPARRSGSRRTATSTPSWPRKGRAAGSPAWPGRSRRATLLCRRTPWNRRRAR